MYCYHSSWVCAIEDNITVKYIGFVDNVSTIKFYFMMFLNETVEKSRILHLVNQILFWRCFWNTVLMEKWIIEYSKNIEICLLFQKPFFKLLLFKNFRLYKDLSELPVPQYIITEELSRLLNSLSVLLNISANISLLT